MRKYKDVGKRILVLVLSVCMIAGVLPAIPAEAADAFPGNGSITLGADANGATASGYPLYHSPHGVSSCRAKNACPP